jgi:hypothetical protein
MCRAVDLLPKVSSKWLSSNQILSSSPPLKSFKYVQFKWWFNAFEMNFKFWEKNTNSNKFDFIFQVSRVFQKISLQCKNVKETLHILTNLHLNNGQCFKKRSNYPYPRLHLTWWSLLISFFEKNPNKNNKKSIQI